MIIQNYDALAETPQRKKLLRIVEAGLAAIRTKDRVEETVQYDTDHDVLCVEGRKYDLRSVHRVVVVGCGKAAYEAVTTLYEILATRITCGFVVDLKGDSIGSLTCTVGSHPYPTRVNVEATRQIVSVLEGLTDKDLVLCVISGGGSSLLCYPYKQSCELQTQIVQALMRAGAEIQELNTVRKHMSLVKGGQLAAAAYPATVINLVFSDVPGDDVAMVASGPTVRDATTVHDAEAVLRKYNVLELCGMGRCELRETPKEDKYFVRVTTHLLVSGEHALRAMAEKARTFGFVPRISEHAYTGIARELGVRFASSVQPGECLLASGESTVVVTHPGKGGRNLEMALAALPVLRRGQAFAAIDSDGFDNTPFAGALVDALTNDKARRMGVSAELALLENGSYQFFEATGDYIDTGLTEANVADLVVSVREPE
ncbi:MAG: DUF4147 domain-containing protein [Candidatus Doudnabacteria bacterium]|nr:DUF4147 domain-containing protein [Candidatus Doudnabacteria bacterium]